MARMHHGLTERQDVLDRETKGEQHIKLQHLKVNLICLGENPRASQATAMLLAILVKYAVYLHTSTSKAY